MGHWFKLIERYVNAFERYAGALEATQEVLRGTYAVQTERERKLMGIDERNARTHEETGAATAQLAAVMGNAGTRLARIEEALKIREPAWGSPSEGDPK